MQDVPEMDGIVYLEKNNNEKVLNQFVKCNIIKVSKYDLIGKIK